MGLARGVAGLGLFSPEEWWGTRPAWKLSFLPFIYRTMSATRRQQKPTGRALPRTKALARAPRRMGGGRPARTATRKAPFPPLDRDTSDTELSEWGEANIPGFLGVFSRDQYSEIYPPGSPMPPGSSAILNLDYGYQRGGTHWVAARVSNEAPLVLYVDSYGMPPAREVTLRSRAEGRGILYPDVQRQGFSEVTCGPRALATLSYLADAAKKGRELEAFGRIGQVGSAGP